MELLDKFNREMAHLLELPQPVTQFHLNSVLKLVSDAATLETVKDIVLNVELSTKKSAADSKYAALLVIDAILRHSLDTLGPDNPFQELFLVNLPSLIDDIFQNCLQRDKAKCYFIVNQWQVNDILSQAHLKPLLEMAQHYMQLNSALQKHLYQASGCMDKPTSAALLETPASSNVTSSNVDYLNEYYSGNSTPTRDEPNYYEEFLATKNAVKTEEDGFKSTNEVSQQQNYYSGTNLQQSGNSFAHRPYSSYYDDDYEEKSAYYRGTSGDEVRRQYQSSYYHEEGESPWQMARGYYYPPSSYASTQGYYARSPRVKPRPSRSRSRSPPPTSGTPQRARVHLFMKPVENHITLASSTLWIGHLTSNITKSLLYDTFIEYGPILDLVLVRKQECAFVRMKLRTDAQRIMNKFGLYNNKQLRSRFGSKATMSWAPGKGLKTIENYRDYWKYEIGQALVPYSIVPNREKLETISLECIIDHRSLPSYLLRAGSKANSSDVSAPIQIKEEMKEDEAQQNKTSSEQVSGEPQS